MSKEEKITIQFTPLEFANLKEAISNWKQYSRSRMITSGMGTETRTEWEDRAQKATALSELLETQIGSDEEN